ncbi:MAG: hypothetical protein HBSAPP03_07890 [Phycisphaerae bacterium]|nr:MAG: hypothetical protein HBSAPP03_07890 [Phycisphaerae bacterium]
MPDTIIVSCAMVRATLIEYELGPCADHRPGWFPCGPGVVHTESEARWFTAEGGSRGGPRVARENHVIPYNRAWANDFETSPMTTNRVMVDSGMRDGPAMECRASDWIDTATEAMP